jgi:hypothetical protein
MTPEAMKQVKSDTTFPEGLSPELLRTQQTVNTLLNQRLNLLPVGISLPRRKRRWWEWFLGRRHYE